MNRHVFPTARHAMSQRLTRALRASCVVAVALMTLVNVAVPQSRPNPRQSGVRTDSTGPDTLRIRSVSPQRAQRGDTIALQFTDSISGIPIRVSIAGLRADRVDMSVTEMLVTVPEDLPANDTLPAITFTAGTVPADTDPFYGLTVLQPARLFPLQSILIGIAIGSVVFFSLAQIGKRTKPMADPLPVSPELRVEVAQEPLSLPPLEIPEGLLDSVSRGESIVYVGAGLSAQAGYPTWTPFVTGLLDWGVKAGYVDDALAQSHRASLRLGGSATVADALVSAVPPDELLRHLREVFAKRGSLPPNYKVLQQLGFSAALTTNFDGLLEQAYLEKNPPVFIPTDSEPLRECLTKNRFFILKLYGALEKPETVLVAPAQFRDAVSRNRSFSTFMESVFLSRTLFFVGASLEGIQAYLDGLGIRRDAVNVPSTRGANAEAVATNSRTHFALVAVNDHTWRTQAETLRLRYNIHVLPYVADAKHQAMDDFLKGLQAQVVQRRGAAVQRTAEKPLRDTTFLDSVHLENIGAFDSLDLTLNPGWNVLLGDNGVGKSTILKAIALGLCGKDGERFAGRLVKVGHEYGKIVLKAGRNTYQTTIYQRDGDAEIESSGRAFEAEGWLTLGFSPIRTITWERPKGPSNEGKRRPTSDDLMPMIRGEVDPRMTNIKQWFINQDYFAKSESKEERSGADPTQVLDDFKTVVGTLLSGMRMDIRVENARTGSVIAITDDGPVPLEVVSQGTASLLGWIGVLVQRLHEVYGQDGLARDRYALVLVDEIDAHMHPAWQRRLITRLKTLFPRVQFIASTHSPLIVGGMETEHLFRFARVDKKVTRVAIDSEAAMGRSDQVLRGQLFDLPVTFDPQTENMMAQYQVLLAKPNPSTSDIKRREELEKELERRIPPADTEPAARRALELVQSVIRNQLFPTPDASQLVMDSARKLLDAAARHTPRA